MTENRRLLLVTGDYPYPGGEQFLETEMEILRRHFAAIDVVAVNYAHRPGKPLPRPVPPEVRIVDFGGIGGFQAARSCARESGRLVARTVQAARHAGIRNPMRWLSLMVIVIRRCDVARRIIHNGVLASSDAVYAYWANTTAYLLAECRALAPPGLLRQPFVTRAHGYDLWAERAGLRRLPFQAAVLAACDRVCPCSEHGANYLRRQYPGHASRIRSFYLGVAPQTTMASTSSDGVLRLLTCSHLIPVKRLHLLADALDQMRRRVFWTHLGDGPDGPALRERCARLGPHARAEFRGSMSPQAVLEFYREHSVDLFVNTSESEGVPVSIMEAFSFGVPAVATNVGGVSELVRPGFGRLLPADFRPADLAAFLGEYSVAAYDRRRIQQWQQQTFSTANYEAFAVQALCRPPGD